MIGICVVYLASDQTQLGILKLSVEQLKKNTNSVFRIYGAVPDSNLDSIRALQDSGVSLVETPTERVKKGNVEHSFLLDLLIERAVSDGCNYIATFDMDSWPIRNGWDEYYLKFLSDRQPLISVVRTELGDNFPQPIFSYFSASFWDPASCSVGLYNNEKFSEMARSFSIRPRESGSGLLATIADRDLNFGYIERSNAWNIHSVIGAVYGNAIFHVGAMSRRASFITDGSAYRINGDPLRRAFADRLNEATREFVVFNVLSEHDRFMMSLCGEGGPINPKTASRENFSKLAKDALAETGALNCAGALQILHKDGKALVKLEQEMTSLNRRLDATIVENNRLRQRLKSIKSEKFRVLRELENANNSFKRARRDPVGNLIHSWVYKMRKKLKQLRVK